MTATRSTRADRSPGGDGLAPPPRPSTWRVGSALAGLWLLLIERDGWRPLLDASVPLRTVPLLVTVAGVALLAAALPTGLSRLVDRTRRAFDGRHPLAAAAVLYLLAWGGTLLAADGLYWDDWTLVGVPREAIVTGFTEFGSPWLAHLHLTLLEVGPWLYRVVTLLVFLGVGVGVHAIVQRVPWLGEGERALMVVLVLVLPLNSARHALIDLPYTLSLGLFVAAWYLLVRERRPRAGTAWLATALLVVSFTTQSLLVFVALPVAHLLLREVPFDRWTPARLGRWARRRWYLLVAPVGFFVAKNAIAPVHGRYAGYNELSVEHLGPAVLPLAASGALFLAAWAARDQLPRPWAATATVVTGGLAVVALGVLPYLAVEHTPGFVEWTSRHQLLLPFGCAVVAVGILRGVRALVGRGPAIRVAASFVLVAVVYSAHLSVSFVVDWDKQRSVIDQLAASPDVAAHRTFVYFDRVLGQNAHGRTWRAYEVNAFLATATGEERRLAIRRGAVSELPEFSAQPPNPRYRAIDHRFDRDEPLVLLEITGEVRPMFWQVFDRPPVRLTTERRRYDELVP